MGIDMDKIKYSLQYGTKNVLKKSEELLDITTLNLNIAAQQSKLKELYKELGERYYKQYLKGEHKKDTLVKLCDEIDEINKEIRDINKKIKQIKGW